MSKKNKGIICIICSAFCFALMNMFVKLSGDLPPIQKSFFRNLVALILALIILLHQRVGFKVEKRNVPALLLRAVFGTLGILCNFYAIDHLYIADASMLNKLSPFFAVIFSALFLKEKLKLYQGLSVLTAFIGALFIIKPVGDFSDILPSLLGMLGGLGAGAAYTAVRYLTQRGQNGSFIVFFFSAFSCAVTLPFLIFDFHPMSLQQLIFLIMAGISAAGGQFTITMAYSYAPAREISVFDYTQIIFSSLLGIVVFSQYPDIYSILGYLIICSVSIFMFFKNKKQS